MTTTDLTEALIHAIRSGTVLDFGAAIGRAIAETPPTRDQLAAMAMQGLVADPSLSLATDETRASVARLAYHLADALLAACAPAGPSHA